MKWPKAEQKTETTRREMNQLAGDLLYRFGRNENLYVGARYNSVEAGLSGFDNDITIHCIAFAAGWFFNRNILLKSEYVIQKYKNFPATDYRAGGEFEGFVIEAIAGF